MSVSRLRRVTISNFGPYKGDQILDFGDSSAPLVLVHGENMAGKTSLLNSLRWLLYGEALDRKGRKMSRSDLLNSEAMVEKNHRFSVEAEIQLDEPGAPGQRIVLKRQAQGKDGVKSPAKDSDYAEHLSIQVDGNVRAKSEYDDYVNLILPKDISRFFLFDGELLNDYENLVRDDDETQAKKVKRAIEQILGLPAVKKGRDDLQKLHREVQKKVNAEAAASKEAQEAGIELTKVLTDLEAAEANRDHLQAQMDEAEQDLRACEADLAQYAEVQDEANRLASLKEAIAGRRADIARLREEIRVNSSEVWRDALEPRLRHEITRLEIDLQGIDGHIKELDLLRHERDGLAQSLSTTECITCGQPLPDERVARTKTQIAGIDKKIQDLLPLADPDRRSEMAGSIARLREIAPAGVISGIQANEKSIRAAGLEISKVERQVDQIMDLLKDRDPGVVLQYEKNRDNTLKRIAKIEAKLDAANADIEDLNAEEERLNRLLRAADSPRLRRLSDELEALGQAVALFDRAIVDLVDELRTEVEAEASAIFKKLTTDKSYSGLQINENYGLTIVGKSKARINVRSAGAEQIVALSLIGALNRMAVQKAPIFMDTPMGRLDKGHRQNILEFFPSLGEQVVLLVHGGELDRDEESKSIKSLVDREFVINHASSAVSTILPLRGGM